MNSYRVCQRDFEGYIYLHAPPNSPGVGHGSVTQSKYTRSQIGSWSRILSIFFIADVICQYLNYAQSPHMSNQNFQK